MRISREELYEQVWAEPMTRVAARYDVSSSFLARVCERLDVPRPERGYWASVAAGKRHPKPPLPPVRPGGELEWTRGGEEAARAPRAAPQATRRTPLVDSRATAPKGRHQLTSFVRELFEAGKQKGGFLGREYLRPSKRLLVDVVVSPGMLDKCLTLATKFFVAAEARGHRVTLAPKDELHPVAPLDARETPEEAYSWETFWRPARATVLYVGTVALGITIYEISERVDAYNEDGHYVRVTVPEGKRLQRLKGDWYVSKHDLPSGRLCIRAYSPYPRTKWQQEWRETRPGELKGRLDEIVSSLEEAAPRIADLVQEAEAQHAIVLGEYEEERRVWERQEEERRQAELRAWQEEQHKLSREQLRGVIDRWSFAREVNHFFEEVRRRAAELPVEDQASILARAEIARALVGTPNALDFLRAWRTPDERISERS